MPRASNMHRIALGLGEPKKWELDELASSRISNSTWLIADRGITNLTHHDEEGWLSEV